jgi:hypothetical protein
LPPKLRLGQQLVPVVGRVAALQHLSEHAVGVIVAIVGALGVAIVDPGINDQLGVSALSPLLQPVPHAAPAAVLLQMVALGQGTEVLLQGVTAGSGQFDGIHHRDASVLAGEFHDLQ